MLIAMGITAFLCIAIGVYPQPLYDLLPSPVEYQAYTTTHVVTQFQLLVLATLAFAVLIRTGLYPAEMRSTNLDTDWIYRRLLPRGYWAGYRALSGLRAALAQRVLGAVQRVIRRADRHHGPQGLFSRTWPTGSTVLWVAVILFGFLLLYYL